MQSHSGTMRGYAHAYNVISMRFVYQHWQRIFSVYIFCHLADYIYFQYIIFMRYVVRVSVRSSGMIA